MCIRDSRQALSLDYQELKDLNEQLKDKKLWVLVNALIEEHNLDELVAVSYTHLDVYKRKFLICLVSGVDQIITVQ